MGKSTDPPRYRPAPHLVNSSFLTPEQLSLYFEDFHDSLERAPGAPDLVFDRLVSNLGDALRSNLSDQQGVTEYLEREEIVSAIDKLGSDIAELRAGTPVIDPGDGSVPESSSNPLGSSNERLYAELAELKAKIAKFEGHGKKPTAISDGAYFELRSSNEKLKAELGELKKKNERQVGAAARPGLTEESNDTYPGMGFMDEYKSHVPFGKTGSAKIPFSRRYHTPPVLCLGLTYISISSGPGLYLFVNNIRNLNYLLTISPGEKGGLYDIRCSWVEMEQDDGDFQAGTVEHTWSPTTTTHAVTFPHKYTAPPQVVVFLKDFGFSSDASPRSLSTFPTNITAEGFELRIESSHDSDLKYASISWASCTTDKEQVVTGCVQSSKTAPGDIFNHMGRGHVQFPSGIFSNPPRVMVGINRFSSNERGALRLSVQVTDITSDDITWAVVFPEGQRASVGFSYIAIH